MKEPVRPAAEDAWRFFLDLNEADAQLLAAGIVSESVKVRCACWLDFQRQHPPGTKLRMAKATLR